MSEKPMKFIQKKKPDCWPGRVSFILLEVSIHRTHHRKIGPYKTMDHPLKRAVRAF